MLRKVLALLLCLPGIACAAQFGQPDGAPVRLGDSAEEVKRVLNTPLDPEMVESAIPGFAPTTWQIQLKTRGIYLQFNSNRALKSIRLQTPFSQAIKGVRIGDPAEAVTRLLGTPIKVEESQTLDAQRKPVKNSTFTYYSDDVTTLRYVAKDNVVDSILIFK